MVEEFKVSTSNFGADVSKGPVVLNAISKGGGKEYHGSAYLYARHFGLNANDSSFNEQGLNREGKPAAPRPESKYFFPGGNFGGPVRFPKKFFGPLGSDNFNKDRDKLFFFVGFEFYKQRLDTGLLKSRVPTLAMRNGDFSDKAYLSLLGSDQVNVVPAANDKNGLAGLINNGIISPSAISPVGRGLLNLLPLPNVTPTAANDGYNYVQSLPIDQNMKQTLTRIDYNVSEKTKFYARYNLQTELQPFPVGLWWRNSGQVPYPTPVEAPNRSDSVSASLTQIFTPTLTNEFVFGYSYIDFPNRFQDPKKVSRTALSIPFKGLFKNGVDQIPSFITAWGGGPVLFNPGGFEFGSLFATKHLVNFADNVTKVYGTHTLKFGAYYEYVINNQPGNNDTNGRAQTSTWHDSTSGNAIADLLLGRLSEYEESNKNILRNIGFNTIEFYATDSWKAGRRLTLDFGARFYHLGKWYDREGIGFAVFDSSKYNKTDAAAGKLPGVTWHDLDKSVPVSGAPTKSLYVAPRVGFAYDLFGSGKTILRGGFGRSYYHDAQLTSGLDIAAGVRTVGNAGEKTFAQIEATTPTPDLITSFEVLDRKDDRQPYVDSWSFTLQQRLPYSLSLETAYVGNRSRDQLYLQNINTVPYDTAGCRANAGSGNCDSFRPFTGYGGVNVQQHIAFQNYNAFQTTLSRQTGRANFLASYTFSKALGVRNGGSQGDPGDQLDLRGHNYGILGYDRTHVFNVAYTVELPNFAKDLMRADNGFARGVLDGWMLSGITQFGSGYPLQANNANFRLSGTINGPGGTTYDAGNVILVAGTPDTKAQPILTCDPRSGLSDNQFINVNCFAAPRSGQNGSYVFPYLKGPGYNNHDLTLAKSFKVSETKKIQFRISANNFLNHPLRSFTEGNLDLDFGPDGKPDPKSINTIRFGRSVYTDPSTGQVISHKFGHRIITLGAKFTF